jgi:hypothetical protein
MGAEHEIAGIIDGIDWSNPDEVDDQGRRLFSVRCRLPFSVPMPSAARAVHGVAVADSALDLGDAAADLGVALQPQARDLGDAGHTGDGDPPARVLPDDGDGIILPDDASGDTGSDDEVTLDRPLVSGIASSTSVDFYGTEMSLRALKLMAVQMLGAGGVAYLPRHSNGLAGAIEWDQIIGRTVHAEVVPAERVEKAFNEAEAQFLLRVTIELYGDEPLAQALLRRVKRGEAIGQSIGGWFTHLQIIQNEDGDVERVIVQGVELDHLAVTRAPANPDSLGIIHLRDKLQASAVQHRAATVWTHLQADEAAVVVCAPRVADEVVAMRARAVAAGNADPAWAERHVLAVVDNGDGTASVKFAVGEHDADDAEEEGKKRPRRDAAEPDHGDTPDPTDQRTVPDQGAAADGPPLDTESAAGQDASTDARRSALPPNDPPPPHDGGTPPEEHAMTEQDLAAMRDAMRSAVTEATTPLIERLDALETAAEQRDAPTPDPTPPAPPAEPSVDDRVAAAERSAADAIARAQAAEQALAAANTRPVRVGRSVVPSIPDGPAAQATANGLVERARTVAPTVAAVAERSIAIVTDEPVPGTKVTRGQLDGALRAMLNAAEADGIITDPNHRAVWQ